MDVADDALAGWHSQFELVLDRVPGFILRNCGIDRLDPVVYFSRRSSAIAVFCGETAVCTTAVVSVKDVTSAASAAAIIARVIVGAHEVESGVKQASFRQTDINRVRSIFGTHAAVAQAFAWSPRLFGSFGNPDFWPKATAAFENSQCVARLGDLVWIERIETGQNTFGACFFGSRQRDGLHPLRRAFHAIRLAKLRMLARGAAVVVESSAPQHTSVSHHAFAKLQDFVRVALPTRDVSNSQVSRVHKSHELW